LGRRQDAVRQTLEAYCAADQAGQGKGDRRVHLTAERLGQALRRARTGLPQVSNAAAALQPVRTRSFEGRSPRLCVGENIGVITYFSLGAGFLTGKYRGEVDLPRVRAARDAEALNPRGLRIGALERVSTAAARRWPRWLAWLMQRPASPRPSPAQRRLRSSTS
jgi:aryl-alcohol dehydrogenase-like predicted oxidoreductase